MEEEAEGEPGLIEQSLSLGDAGQGAPERPDGQKNHIFNHGRVEENNNNASFSAHCGLQLTFLSSGLRLGSGASSGLGGSRFLSCNKFTALRASISSSGTPLSPPRAADSWDMLGKGCRGSRPLV